MIFVLDTNVLVSAALGDGHCRDALQTALRIGKLAISTDTFLELVRVLERPRLQKYLREEDKVDYLSSYLRISKSFEPMERVLVCRDARDNMFLELALCCSATAIVTRDADLLTLGVFRGIPVMTVSNFMKRFHEQ